jgi:hypothetical protein
MSQNSEIEAFEKRVAEQFEKNPTLGNQRWCYQLENKFSKNLNPLKLHI